MTDQTTPGPEHARLPNLRKGMGDLCYASNVIADVVDLSLMIKADDLKAAIKKNNPTSNQQEFLCHYIDSIQDDQEKLSKLLVFITGSSAIPAKEMPIKIVILENSEKLPEAHTCFNRIDLPAYPDQTTFDEKLQKAIDETLGGGMYID